MNLKNIVKQYLVLCSDPCSRYHYYLQMKKNVLQSKIRAQDELIFTLAATSLHLDVGTFDSETHKGHYFDPSDYVPAWVSAYVRLSCSGVVD